MRVAKVKKANLLSNMFKYIARGFAMALLSLFVYTILALLFAGCAKTQYVEVIKTVEVKTPVECNIPAPVLAPYRGGEITQEERVKNETNIYIYAEDLEETLKRCKGEK